MKKIIEIEDVKFAYNAGYEILKGINLEVFQGEIMVLLGHNSKVKFDVEELLKELVLNQLVVINEK